ncbi:hypothetical protein J2Y55_004406 [Bosea sp. BE125]|nr:hypothetical protein [Bosea sp. BE125]MDR6873382.1 hypothetical protein [Bosea sp. BE125]
MDERIAARLSASALLQSAGGRHCLLEFVDVEAAARSQNAPANLDPGPGLPGEFRGGMIGRDDPLLRIDNENAEGQLPDDRRRHSRLADALGELGRALHVRSHAHEPRHVLDTEERLLPASLDMDAKATAFGRA